jgi:hypothetical protein
VMIAVSLMRSVRSSSISSSNVLSSISGSQVNRASIKRCRVLKDQKAFLETMLQKLVYP